MTRCMNANELLPLSYRTLHHMSETLEPTRPIPCTLPTLGDPNVSDTQSNNRQLFDICASFASRLVNLMVPSPETRKDRFIDSCVEGAYFPHICARWADHSYWKSPRGNSTTQKAF